MQMDIKHPLARFHKAYLDGKELKNCIFADEEAGVAHCREEDAENPGLLKLDAHNNEIISHKHGKVQIVYVGEANHEPPTRTVTGYRDSPSNGAQGTKFST